MSSLLLYYYVVYPVFILEIADIIEKGIREHPELNVGTITDGIEDRSVGNTHTLHESALVEAFNLKAAIDYQLKNCKLQRFLITIFFFFFF